MDLALNQYVKPISELRTNAAVLINQIRTTQRPLILTRHGRKAAVLLAIEEYEALLAKVELLADLAAAGQDIVSGRVGRGHAASHELQNKPQSAV